MAHFLITGHTGFKGSWLAALLKSKGHEVSGISLSPVETSFFSKTGIADELLCDFRIDIRNGAELRRAIKRIQPDYVVHLAAQALVSRGYEDPVLTYQTNVMGTLNLLEACASVGPLCGQIIITSDKVYRNSEGKRKHKEPDSLGASDPYSNSKAMADLLAQQWFGAHHSKLGCIARAGNVIGMGDYGANRLLPDLLRAIQTNDAIELRLPHAVRPWQHVLDCLQGYLMALNKLTENRQPEIWNFGPPTSQVVSVAELVRNVEQLLNQNIQVVQGVLPGVHETQFLFLDPEKANTQLGWKPLLNFEEGLRWTLFEAVPRSPVEIRLELSRQITEFEERRKSAGFPV